jgi:hypothetical protein
MTTLCISFHGGSSATSINNILAATTTGPLMPVLAPNALGSLPSLCELRGFFAADNLLYVVNAYKDFSNILTFSPPANAGNPYTFAGFFAAGASDGLAHPFCAALVPNGDLYVSNQDMLSGQNSSAITYYEGPTKDNPGKYKGVFAGGFITLRGIATDGTYWYVSDEGNSRYSGTVWILDSSGNQKNSLSIDQPVHLLYDGTRYLYIGSEAQNAVYRYDTQNGDTPVEFITSSSAVKIDHTAGLAICGPHIYVASRKSGSVNQYLLTDPSQASVYVNDLSDEPEFLLFF